ncbi:MAG: N-acetyl-gamma-glutamyl-phosphate reductase [Vicinamibacterales bacterium]
MQHGIHVGIVGATGYAGQELVRLLARHPQATLVHTMASGAVDTPRRLPALTRIWDGPIVSYAIDALAADVETVFLALPEAAAAAEGAALVDRGLRVIDLSGAFRIRETTLRAQWYPATPAIPEGTVYGLAEYNAEAFPAARLISCPGCYPTGALIALKPLVDRHLLDGDLIVDAKSGISGAGKAATDRTHFCENHGSVAAYGVFSHRHTAELEQELGRPVTFVPHLVPLDRGILETIYARVRPGVTAETIAETLQAAYADRAFVRLRGDAWPEIKHVAHTNFCDVGWRVDAATGRLVLVTAIDNLVKGAAGQAVQNFNLAYGLPETMGLV